MTEVLRTAEKQRAAGRVLIPFTAMTELELYLLRRLPSHTDRILGLVESWPAQIVESDPQWRREAVRLQSSLGIPRLIAWPSALALLHHARLVHKELAYDTIPGLRGMKIG